jgi:hypothetical protein
MSIGRPPGSSSVLIPAFSNNTSNSRPFILSLPAPAPPSPVVVMAFKRTSPSTRVSLNVVLRRKKMSVIVFKVVERISLVR